MSIFRIHRGSNIPQAPLEQSVNRSSYLEDESEQQKLTGIYRLLQNLFH